MKKYGYSYMRRRIVMLFLLLFPSVSIVICQDIKINIKAPESVMTGEHFRLDYIIESDTEIDDPVIMKNIEGFKILYGPSVSKSAAVTFNKGKRETVYRTSSTYYLEAEKEGKYTLPKAEISVNGKKFKSDSHKIEVRSIEVMTEDIDAFVKTIVSKNTIHPSDTLTLTYRLYTTRDINQIRNSDFPPIRDFYYDNITRSRQTFVEEEIDGRIYKIVDIRVLILQPRREGRFTIPEGEISVEYLTPTGKQMKDIWGEIYEETIRTVKKIKIDSVEISVFEFKEI